MPASSAAIRARVSCDSLNIGSPASTTSRWSRLAAKALKRHSSWRISEIDVLNDAITSGATYDIGLYQTAENGGAAVDADCYATDVSFTTARAATGAVELGFEAKDVANIEKRVWEDAGLSADPGRYYDLCLTGDAVGSGAGTISVRVRYVEN